MKTKTRQEVATFLNGLQWKRMSQKSLENLLRQFFGVPENCLIDFTDPDYKSLDYCYGFTSCNGKGAFWDIEIWYLKMRNRNLLITGAEIIQYVK